MSDSIKITGTNYAVYPASNRQPKSDYKARLNVEENIVKANNTITNINSYVVNGLEINAESNTFTLNTGTCVINGYVIKIAEPVNLKGTNLPDTDCYVYITLPYKTYSVEIGSAPNTTTINLTETTLSDIFNNNGTYDTTTSKGITCEITDVATDSFDDCYSLFIGKVSKNENAYDIDYNCREARITSDTVRLDINANSGLIEGQGGTAKTLYLQDFLNNIIIDDGVL